MTSITIPRTIKSAQAKLTELGELATATEWQRAALVAAYVQERAGQGTSVRSDGSLESATAFAARGIIGLTSATTVLIYARAWLNITDEDGNVIGHRDRPKPGSKVTIPDDKWPPTRTGTDGYNSDDGAVTTIGKIVGQHGLNTVLTTVFNLDPYAAAAAVVDNTDVDEAVSVVRTERLADREGMEEMRWRTAARDRRIDDAINESTTEAERTGLAEHEGNVHLRQAAMHLALAAAEFERNPVLVDDQESRRDETMRRIDHYTRLLHGDGEWTDDDDSFLADLGIEGVTS